LEAARLNGVLVVATGTEIKVVENLPSDEFIKTFPEGTPRHVIEDAGVDIYKVFGTYGCKHALFPNIRRRIDLDPSDRFPRRRYDLAAQVSRKEAIDV
jgi:cbb3-type cytochrome oxidase cytochrome c subunit